MNSNHLYKHVNNRDVAFRMIESTKVFGGYEMQVQWFNIVNPKNIFLIKNDKIFIKIKDLKNWLVYLDF